MSIERRSFLSGAAASAAAVATRALHASPRARDPQIAPRATRVLFLFCPGGISHVDAFDPKPALDARHGKTVEKKRVLERSRWRFRANPRCGTEISDLFPVMRSLADRFLLVRSMNSSHGDHYAAALQMHTGSGTFTRPSLGAWVSYALGSANTRLPAHVVLAPHMPYAGAQLWSAGFLPAEHQGVHLQPGPNPIAHLRSQRTQSRQELELELLHKRNARHAATRVDDGRLHARDASFDVAAAMQESAPEVFDLSDESDATLELYGLKRGQNKGYAWQCLIARRMLEREVRFVEVLDVGASQNWDHHSRMFLHAQLARRIDIPIAALLVDLERRGLLDDTLVVWTTEFGCSPFGTGTGRGHWPKGFSGVLAGAGIRRGEVYGATDELGWRATESRMHVHDLHATMLYALGFDHRRLTYRHAGRDFRLTDVAGHVHRGVFA